MNRDELDGQGKARFQWEREIRVQFYNYNEPSFKAFKEGPEMIRVVPSHQR